jgi:hypothetical protein
VCHDLKRGPAVNVISVAGVAVERVDAFADAANGSLLLIGAHSTERPYSWGGADFVTMPLDDVRGAPTYGGDLSDP